MEGLITARESSSWGVWHVTAMGGKCNTTLAASETIHENMFRKLAQLKYDCVVAIKFTLTAEAVRKLAMQTKGFQSSSPGG